MHASSLRASSAIRRILATAGCGVAVGLVLAPGAWASATNCDTIPPPGTETYEGRHVVRGSGNIEGTNGDDFIIGSSGNDTIRAKYGKDTVCAGAGEDIVYGGGLDDYLYGEGGNDELFGELQDDKLHGGSGRDLLVGGHGVDEMFGEEGNDWLRGGTNKDVYDGGMNENDNDVASFVTATPSGSHAGGVNGVVVNLSGETQAGVLAHEARGEGNDEVKGIESVVGSPFNDVIVGSGRPNQHLYGGMGTNECTPGPCEEPASKLTAPFAYLDLYSPFSGGTPTPDPSFVIVGGASSESLSLTNTSGGFQATASLSGLSEPLGNTGPCSHGASEGEVNCSLSPKPVGGGATAFGGEGGDAITVTNGFPEGVSVDIDGGEGSDTLTGSSSGEDLFSGNSGNDVMHGGAGSDALISEGTGADQLYGESGNDQLVTNNPCEGVLFSGGEDTDIAGFARTVPGENGAPANGGVNGIDAWLGEGSTYGGAYIFNSTKSGNVCAGGAKASVGGDLEVLEGTRFNDELVGNEANNTIWGREGDDELFGAGGNDIVEGEKGNDGVHGGAGVDTLLGGGGFDKLYARESPALADKELNCGGEGGVVETRDTVDPAGLGC
jgi:Ca2+-binding RTX toxin-like protein